MSKLLASQIIFANNVGMLLRYIYESGFGCTFGDAYRSPEQAEINAKKGIGIDNSQHCKRLAIDLNLFSLDGTYLTDPQSYKKFGDYWKSLNTMNRFGGDFRPRVDSNHFEMYDDGTKKLASTIKFISENFGIESIKEVDPVTLKSIQ